MKLVILQPGYLPWLGFFDQMNWADTFVIYDDVQYTKNNWRNRNRIKGPNGVQWLTIPVKHHLGDLIKDIHLPQDRHWLNTHLKSLQFSYSKAKYFHDYFPRIHDILGTKYRQLTDLNMALIEYLNSILGINTKIVCSSRLAIGGSGTERLINICKNLGASQYLTGDAARNYLNSELFTQNEIDLIYHNYQHPEYTQLFGAFIPYLSIVDLIFNCGPASLNIFTKKD